MNDLLAADDRARARALEVTSSFIVQAPAGAGKTELLTRRYLALLATVAEPESILAITFTRKAAAEMRERILGALRSVARPDPDRPVHAQTLALARAALAADERRGWNLLGQPERLRIRTIDALNLGLARRLPVLSGLGASLGIEEDARELYREAAERLLSHLPQGIARYREAVATLLAHVDNRVDRFVELVVEMLARREAWLPLLPGDVEDPVDEASFREALESSRAALVRGRLRALRSAWPDELLRDAAAIARAAASTPGNGDVPPALAAWRDASGLPGDELDSVSQWIGLSRLLLTDSGRVRSRFDARLGFPPGPAGQPLKQRAGDLVAALGEHPELLELLREVRTLPPARYDIEEWRVLVAQFRVLRLAVAELELVFSGRRAADYPRFAAAARQALGTPDAPTDTALVLDAELRHVLVDEFQDTSEAQVRLLESLTAGWQRGDGRTLFLVGDPMQSIYRFRNAEVGLFLDIRERGLAGLPLEPLTLAVNFRSTAPVVEWVNACFEQVLSAPDDVLRGAVRYVPGVPRPGAGADGGVRVHPLLRRSRQLEAEQVADIVVGRLVEDPRARVGILVQGRSHLLHVVGELARRGIDFRATDIDPLGERPVVLDLLALTRALAHAADRTAWLAVLRAPICGLSVAELHTLFGDDPEATIAELLGDATRRGRLVGPSLERLDRAWHVLEAARQELRRFGLRDTVERAWHALLGPATLGVQRDLEEAEAYFDVLADLEAAAAGPVDLAKLARALGSLYAPSRERPDVRVELLTIHKAKGLQYDTVIVPGLERPPGRDGRRLLHWLKLPLADRDELVVAPLAGTGDEPNAMYEWLETLEREKLLQERRRLLYVAATRAERWLHLFGSAQLQQAGESPELRQPSSQSALGLLWPMVGADFRRRLEEVGDVAGEVAPDDARVASLRRLPVPTAWPDLPATPAIRARSASRSPAGPEVEFDWVTETARHVGTVVHRELQRLARSGEAGSVDEQHARERWLTELAELGVPGERRAAAVARVADAVRRTLDDPRGRWLLDTRHRYASTELALTGPVSGELARIVIDRMFVDANGTRWIVDYKTSSHEGAGLETFLDREQQRYASQLQRYAMLAGRLGPEPVRLGLYFPLLSAWREWTAGSSERAADADRAPSG
jgi:ATP-dependent helicase/nuclease subunit A